ncbi:hypothetical protein [Paraburkholderia strydomiana]
MRTLRPVAPTLAHRKLPAVLADAEIAHLEAVVSYLFNSQEQDLPEYLDSSYWIARVEAIDQRFQLVPRKCDELLRCEPGFLARRSGSRNGVRARAEPAASNISEDHARVQQHQGSHPKLASIVRLASAQNNAEFSTSTSFVDISKNTLQDFRLRMGTAAALPQALFARPRATSTSGRRGGSAGRLS